MSQRPSSHSGYQLRECHSESVPLADLAGGRLESWLRAQAHQLGPAWVVAQLQERVGWGVLVDGVLHWDEDQRFGRDALTLEGLLDARIFNEQAELHLWRDADASLRGRLRRDRKIEAGQRGETRAVDEYWYLWGTKADPGSAPPGWTRLTEARGTTLRLPLRIVGQPWAVRLKVRHYLKPLDQDELWLPSFADTRFVGLVDARGPGPWRLYEPRAPEEKGTGA